MIETKQGPFSPFHPGAVRLRRPLRFNRLAALASMLVALSGPLAALPAAACPGDCDGDRVVVVSELIRGVNIALGSAPVSECVAFDGDESGLVEVNELIQGVNAALDGCAVEPIFPANYRETFALLRDCRFSIEHGGVSVRVFGNDIAAGPYARHENPLPTGSIVVKEEFGGPDCSNDADLLEWRAMRKEAPGFDPEDADWHWQWVDPDRSVLFDDKGTCISCHRQAECRGRDYMCTEGETPLSPLALVLRDLAAALLSIAGSSATEVYAAGADPGDGGGPLILRYDGQNWRRLRTGATGDLWWVSVTPIGGSFLFSGEGGLVLEHDPSAGTFVRHQTPGDELLFGIWGPDPSHIWAVGGDLADEEAGGVVWFYDGSEWRAEDLSGVRTGGIPTLYKVWGRNARDVWAVGRLGVILHFDGDRWAQVESSSVRPLFTVHGNDSLVVATGGFFDGVIVESSGGAFAGRAPAGAPQMNGVFVTPESQAAAVGIEGAVAFRRNGAWELQDPPIGTVRDFHSSWIDPEGGTWAVGGDLSLDLTSGIVAYGGFRAIGTEVVDSEGP